MNLALESRWVSFVLRVGDARKLTDDDDDPIVVDVSGGSFEPAPVFGFQYEEEPDE